MTEHIELEDQQVISPEFLKNLMAHYEIINDNLVITIDSDNNRAFSDLLYLQLMGKNPFEMSEKEREAMTTTDLVKKFYQRHVQLVDSDY